MSHSYRIADCHAHIYPEKIAAKATAAVGEFYQLEMHNETGTSQLLLERGQAIGVERYVVCSVATTVPQIESIDRFIAQECQAHPEFIGLGAYHVDAEDPQGALDLMEELGLKGIKIHPDFQRFNVDDPRMMPLYEELARRGYPILIHMGDVRYDYSAPWRLARVLEQVPGLKAIGAHLGGYSQWEDAIEVLGKGKYANTQLYVDCSSSLAFLEPQRAAEIIRGFGVDRVLFGVDYPMWTHESEFENFLKLGFSEEENQAILYDNFARFFELD